MILLSGNALGERQKQLNEMVIKASVDDFNDYKTEAAPYDVDKIFLIDLASKGKNVDFILETLKSGDIIQITRALNKSKWIGEDKYVDIINIDNLHLNIFPSISIKMKKKVLSALSTTMLNENRSIEFYEYCMKQKLYNIAIKFLYNAPEKYKHDVILQKESEASKFLLSNMKEVAANFIGNSFLVAQTFLETMDNAQSRGILIMLLHNMYSISNEKYLDLLEKFKNIENKRGSRGFGRRISKDIIKKHKARVLRNPCLYLKVLHKSIVSSNSTASEVKIYAVALLPDDAETFWNENFYHEYQFILDIIPTNEKFTFMKKIFSKKYPGKTFEMSKEFYSYNFYNLMTNEEKEIWALKHIRCFSEILGDGNDYTWYRFVQFDQAFEEIKKLVLITSDDDKRVDIVNILIDSAKSNNEIETLLKYFHDRFMNKDKNVKFMFLKKLTEKFKVFEFHETCWILFEKLLDSLGVYDINNRFYHHNFIEMTLIYYILASKTVPAVLNEFLRWGLPTADEMKMCCHHLQPKQSEKVFQFMLRFYHASVEALASKEIENEIVTSVRICNNVRRYLNILKCQSKTKDEIPDLIYRFIKMDWRTFKDMRFFESKNESFSERNIVRLMKKDATLIINEFSLIKKYIEGRNGRTNWLIQKLKLYFQHDIAQKYLQLLTDCLASEDVYRHTTKVAVYGVLMLADQSFKIDFLKKYAPTNPKIDHNTIPKGLLQIQRAICVYAALSRPPLPLSSIHQYIIGDYAHRSLRILNSYLVHLPLPACVSFIESLIAKQVTIHKHGLLPLAFQYFSTSSLKTLLNDLWKTSNFLIRKMVYKSLYERVLKESDDQCREELFEELKRLTLDIHEDDYRDIFELLVNGNLPISLRVQLLVAAWKTVNKLPDGCLNFGKRTSIINAIKKHVHFVPEVEIEIIIDEHVSYMFENKLFIRTYVNFYEEKMLNKAKWDLTLAHLTNIYTDEQLKKRTLLLKIIIEKCVVLINEERPPFPTGDPPIQRNHEVYVKYYQFCHDFIKDLQRRSYDCHKPANCLFVNRLISTIYHQFCNSQLKCHEIFPLAFKLRFNNKVCIGSVTHFNNTTKRSDRVVAFSKCLTDFAESIINFMRICRLRDEYFPSVHKQIDDFILEAIHIIYNKVFGDDNYLNWKHVDIIVTACVVLLRVNIFEGCRIVLRILPVDYNGPCIIEYRRIIDQLKNYDNQEVRYFFYEKFVLRNLIR